MTTLNKDPQVETRLSKFNLIFRNKGKQRKRVIHAINYGMGRVQATKQKTPMRLYNTIKKELDNIGIVWHH